MMAQMVAQRCQKLCEDARNGQFVRKTPEDEEIDLGILVLRIGEEAVFRFADPEAILLEVPAELERDLIEIAELRAPELTGKRLVMDLGDVRSISSRHLGIILTVQKALARFGALHLARVSKRVQGVLRLIEMDRLFELSE